MDWYVKISVYGVVVPDATTWHETKNDCLTYIMRQLNNGNHPSHTIFHYGKDGQKAEEVHVK